MPRSTVTTTPSRIVNGADLQEFGGVADTLDDARARSYLVGSSANTGVIVLEVASASMAPADIANNGYRHDLAKGALSITVEPGRALWAATASGSTTVDVLAGGER